MVTRRSWYSVSLRTLLIGMTLLSMLCAWQFYYRGQAVREQKRIVGMFAGTKSHPGFRYMLLGWDVPYKFAKLWRFSFPELESVTLRPDGVTPLPDTFCEIARQCQKVEYEGSEGGDDAYLRRCASDNLQELLIMRNGVTGECLAFVGECPNLRKIEVRFVPLTAKSLAAILNHPRIEVLDIDAETDDLANLGELTGPNALQRLELDLTVDWRRFHDPSPSYSVSPSGLPRPTSFTPPTSPVGDFVWLEQCTQLRELTIELSKTDFIDAVGRHLQGVERLNAQSAPPKELESLGAWKRLRHLCLDGPNTNDEQLAHIARVCPNLHTLEIDEYSESGVALTPQGFSVLKNLPGLTRLRLGGCNLTQAHMVAIAEIGQLEELSLEDSLDDQAIAPLQKLPKLQRISLERTGASERPFANIRGDWDERRPWRN